MFVESISHTEMRDSFRIVHFRESQEKSRGKSGSTVRPARGNRKPGGSVRVCVPFLSPRVVMREGDSHRAALWLIDGYDVFVTDIYSCDRP